MLNLSKTLLVAISLLGSIDASLAAPAAVHKRDDAPTLLKQGGPQLSDIAVVIPDNGNRPEEEKASIFAQTLIATRKLNKAWPVSMFEGYNGDDEVKADTAKVLLFKGPSPAEAISYDAKHDAALEVAKKQDELTFGMKPDSPWWPYALFEAAIDAGWRADLEGRDLARQTIEIVTGRKAQAYSVEAGGDNQDYLNVYYINQHKYPCSSHADVQVPIMVKADHSPVLLQLEKFDTEKHADLKEARWESWVTVMSFNQDEHKLKYATSFVKFSESDGDISQEVDWNEIKVVSAVFLSDGGIFDGRPSEIDSRSEDIVKPTQPA